jgi:hypothetical protein
MMSTSTPPLHTYGGVAPRRRGEKEDLDKLTWENEDESFEVPDFHFDWGVAKEKTREMQRLEALSLGTPPPRPPSGQSSASSGHLLTDASTATASSFIPTPPGTLGSTSSGSGGSNGIRRSYGARSFQRVVSAPLARKHEEDVRCGLDFKLMPDCQIKCSYFTTYAHTHNLCLIH